MLAKVLIQMLTKAAFKALLFMLCPSERVGEKNAL